MSITSSNNLTVNNSFSVNGNTILGTNTSNTLICNANTTFHNPLTLNGNFVQNSGTLSTTSDTNYLNGNVVIGGSKTFTTGTGLTTINGITQANNDIKILTGASLYVSNSSLTQYLRVHHNLNNSYIDYTGDMILRKNGTMTAMSIASSDNKATFPYGLITNTINVSGTASCAELNCSSINNTGTLATGVLEITSTTSPCYIDMKTSGNNPDFDVGIATSGGVVGTPGQGTLTISSASTIINSPLNVNSSVGCTSINNSGQLTQTGGDVVLSSGRSVYITDGGTNYVRLHHSGTASVLDFTGGLSVRNGGATTPLSISSSNNQGTFNCILNTKGITNSTDAITNNSTLTQVGASSFSGAITNNSTLTQAGLASFSNNIKVNTGGFVYVTDAGLTNYFSMHHNGTSSYLDFTGGLSVRNGGATTPLSISSSNNQATFGYNLNTTGITNSTNALVNNGVFTQNNTSSFSSAITAPSITSSGTFYAGSFNNFDATAISSPKVINGIASGTSDGATYTNFNLAINSWNGVGFVYSNPAAPSVCKLVINNRTGDLSTQGTITCNDLDVATALEITSTTQSTSSTTGALIIAGGVGIAKDVNVASTAVLNAYNINNIKNCNIRGYSTKSGGSPQYSWLFSLNQTTYTTNSLNITIESGCFCIQILYSYYTYPTVNYQGATFYHVLKYTSSGTWITNGGAGSTINGAFQAQPTISASEDILSITHNAVANNNDYTHFSYKIEFL